MRMLMARERVFCCLCAVTILTVAACPAAEADNRSLSFSIPSQNGATDWFETLWKGEAATLTVDVGADEGYVILTGNISRGNEGISTSGGPTHFTIVVPATVPARTYTFTMDGTYCRVGPGPGEPEVLPWYVTAKLPVNVCAHEESGILDEENPTPAEPTVNLNAGADVPYSVDVDPVPGTRMGDVIDRMNAAKPGPEQGEFHDEYEYSFDVELAGPPTKVDCKVCPQKTWHAEAKVASVTTTWDYYIEMPNWLQSGEARQAARDAWNEFRRRLRAHEQGHQDRLEGFWTGEDAEATLDDLMKTLAYGEAHDIGRAKYLAVNELKALCVEVIEVLMARYEAVQQGYDDATQHGVNQSAVDGDDVVLPDTNIPLK